MRCASSWSPRSAWWSACFLALALFCFSTAATAQTASSPSSDRPPTASSPSTSTQLSLQAWELVTRLKQRRTEMQSLADSLRKADEASQTSDASLVKAQALQAALATGLMGISSSLQLSLSELNASRGSADDYHQFAEKQISHLQLERDAYAWGAWIGAGATLGAIGGAALGRDVASSALGAIGGAALGAAGKTIERLLRSAKDQASLLRDAASPAP